MLKGLRCDNEERVWETAFALAFVLERGALRGQGYSGAGVFDRAGELAEAAADSCVMRLRCLRDERE
jgi:hypothetical protein